jgi:hypothetical protein
MAPMRDFIAFIILLHYHSIVFFGHIALFVKIRNKNIQIIDLYAKLEKIFITTNMKKLFFVLQIAFLITNFFIFGNLVSGAQCVPDASIKSSGVFLLHCLQLRQMWLTAKFFSFISPKDTIFNYLGQNINATIDSLFITGVKGMPAGLYI